jgi:hypothetical protein
MHHYLNLLMYLHSIIWLCILFLGIFNKNICLIIIYLIIPCIYIIHIFPFHFLVKNKIDYIITNWTSLEKYSDKNFTPNNKEEENDLKELSKYMKLPYEKLLLYFSVYNHFLDPISKNFFKLKKIFDNSFKNPFSTQGLMILAFIMNLIYLKFIYKTF